ncbi:MAG: rRNA maturation RNase YbeY [Williamsia sp.]|nr:rRNA maturation RNase YbeY [Williamsia sp.]
MATNHPTIHFYFNYPFSLKHRRLLKSYIIRLFQVEQTHLASLSIIFCSDEQLYQMNLQYLSHDTLTDILTFPLSEPGDPLTGELYISVDRIRDNATLFHTSSSTEMLRVIFHGCLHLCGYNDKTIRQKKIMTQREDFHLYHYKLCST